MTLTALAVSSAPLLRAIDSAVDFSPKALAQASGRKPNNIARDLRTLSEAGLIIRTGEYPELTELARTALAAIDNPERGRPAAGVAEIALALIDTDPALNPRTEFDPDEIEALAASIRDKGVVQPILLRPAEDPTTGRYRVVAGERRTRAARAAGLESIPAMVRELSDDQALEIAVIENIQRVDLSPLEEARAYRQIIDARRRMNPLMSELDARQTVAQAVRKTERYVDQRIDLLELPPMLQIRVALPKDNEQTLSLSDARREVQQMRLREKRKADRKLTPLELLTVAEILDKTGREPVELESWYYSSTPVEAAFDAAGEAYDALYARYAIRFSRGHYDDPRTFVRIVEDWSAEINEQLAAVAPKRAAALQALRTEILGPEDAKALKASKAYSTGWLNGPFELDPEIVARAEQAAERQRERDEKDAKELAERKADKARLAADTGEPGKAFLAAVRAFEDEAPGLSHEEFTPAFAALLAAHNVPGPFALTWAERDSEITDSNGAPHRAAGPALEARRRLLVIGVNYAAGFAAFSGPDLPTPWSAEGEAETDPLDDDIELDAIDDDEAEHDTEAAGDEDEAVPSFLRNLAGPGDQAEAGQ